MKPEEKYQYLKDLAEKMDITVSEENLKLSGVKVKSGMCVLKGRRMFILDKHKSVKDKVEILTDHLCAMPFESIYIIPEIRDMLEKYKKAMGKQSSRDSHNKEDEAGEE